MNRKWWISGVSMAALCASSMTTPAFAQDGSPADEITVTGSFIKKKNQADQVSPISLYDKNDLDNIAAFNPVDLVNTLTVNAGAQNNADGFNQSNSIGTTNINLRGLGVSSTLVLLNGRRQTQSASATLNGDQFVDLNSLVPAIAIDRVEVLKDGATSLYGSDAVAGVVNFLTRDKFTGFELDSNYISTTEDAQDDLQASALWGGEWGGTNAIVAFSYFNRSDLSASQRKSEFNLRDASSIFGQPGTFLPLAGPSAFTRVPDPSCATVAASDPSVLGVIPAGPIAGTCQFDFGDFFTLVAAEKRYQGFVKVTHDFDSFKLALDGGFAVNNIQAKATPSQPILFPPVIPPTNPGNFLGVPALFFGRVLGAGAPAHTNRYDSNTWRFSAVASGDLGATWSWEAGFVRARNTYNTLRGDTKIDRFMAAISGMGGPANDKFFNPLFGAANDPAVINDIIGNFSSNARANLLTFDGHATGDLFTLPAGPVSVALGVQYRKNKLSYDYGNDVNSGNLFFNRQSSDFNGDLDVFAVFGETSIPLFKGFEISAAVRYEDFGSGVNSTDPKIGFLYRPTEYISFRGTYGTSFRAPSIFQLNGVSSVPARIFDPATGGFATISQSTAGDPANPVIPQDSNTYNVGFTFSPVDTGFSLSLDYWRFEFSNFITPENATALVAADPFGPQVTRDPSSGSLLAVTTFFRNAGSLNTDGFDIGAKYNLDDTPIGEFVATIDVTRVISYDLNDPVAGPINGLGKRNFTNFGVPSQKWKGNVGLGWRYGAHSANVFIRYIGTYRDENNGNAKINDNTVVDLQYNLDIASWITDSVQKAVITVGAKNVFDQQPPDVVSRTGFDSLTHSPLGRQVYVGVKFGF